MAIRKNINATIALLLISLNVASISGMDVPNHLSADHSKRDEKREREELFRFPLLSRPGSHTEETLVTIREAYAHEIEHDGLANRDAFIKEVVHAATEKVLAHRIGHTQLTATLVVSQAADRTARVWDKVDPGTEVDPASSGWERYLQTQRRAFHVDTQASLNVLAVPARALDLVNNVLSHQVMAQADRIGLTQERVDEIARITHHYITQKAPVGIKNGYNHLMNTSEKLFDHFKNNMACRLERGKVGQVSGMPFVGAQPAAAALMQPGNTSIQFQQKLREEIKHIHDHLDRAVATQEELLRLEQCNATRQEIAAVQARIENDRKTLHQIGMDGVEGFSTVARLAGDPRMAYQVSKFGSSAIKIVDSMAAINQARTMQALAGSAGNAAVATAATTMLATAQPWIGLGVGILSLISSIAEDDDGGTDASVIILEEIASLSRKIDLYHMQTMKGIHKLDKHLDAQDAMLLQNFFDLHKGQKITRQELAQLLGHARQERVAIQGNVEHVGRTVALHHRVVLNNFQALRVEGIQDEIDQAENAIMDPRLSPEKFRDYVTKLSIKATRRAKDHSLTGGAVDTTSDHAITLALGGTSALGNIWEHPAFNQVNLLTKYCARRFNTDAAPLANPLIWTECADTIARMFDRKLADPVFPIDGISKDLDLEKLVQLRNEGARLAQFIEAQAKGKCIEFLGVDVQKTLNELINLIQKEIAEYESSRSQDMHKLHECRMDAEISTLKSAPIECTGCVKRIDNLGGLLRAHLQEYNTICNTISGFIAVGASCYLPKYYLSFRGTNVSKETNEMVDKLRPGSASTLFNPQARVLKVHGEHEEIMKRKYRDKMPKSLVDLHAQTMPHLPTFIAHPVQKCAKSVTLALPEGALPTQAQYCEYFVEEDFFHLKAYESSDKKNLLYHAKKKYERSNLYDADENLLHYWYGGRYPKEVDCAVSQFDNTSAAGYYPPIEPYPAARDTWCQDAIRVVVPAAKELHEQVDQQILMQERQSCTRKLMALMVPSSNSAISQLLQKLDAQLQMAQSMAAFMYNEGMYNNQAMRKEFAALFEDQPNVLTSSKAIRDYLQRYVQDNVAARRPYELVSLLKNAAQNMQQTMIGIMQSAVQPKMNNINQLLVRLDTLIEKYKKLVPSQAYEFRALEQQDLFADCENARLALADYLVHSPTVEVTAVNQDKDATIAALMASNAEHKKKTEKLEANMELFMREQVATRLEVQGLREQMAALIALLSQKK